uniref:guanine nucleotide-binding protein subunit beta-like protein 1 n=1 Tax=Styela clava TaxID=7725 RepID=UPI001939C3DA|nr:guanine nucleotide-binding protein subunit beta-like protein 1 [Styela clava]
MEPPSPLFVLKKAAESITDLHFWCKVPMDGKKRGSDQQSPSHLIAGYTNQGGVDIWNLHSRRVESHIPSDHGIISVCGNNNGEIVILNREGELKLFANSDDKLKFKGQIYVPNVGFCKASCLFQNNVILTAVTGEEKSSISVWNFTEQVSLWRLTPSENSMLGMVMCTKLFINDSLLLLIGGYENGSVSLWNVKEEVMMCIIALYDSVPIMCLDFNTATMCGVAGSPTEIVTKFEIRVDDNKKHGIHITKTRTLPNEGIADIKIRPDSKIIAAGGWHDGSVRIFSFKTLKPLAILKYHDGTVQSIAFYHHSDSSKQLLASGSETHKIAVWKIYND